MKIEYGCKVYASTWDGSVWQTDLIDLGGNLAHRNDIVTDKKGFSHVSYRRSGKQRFDDTGNQIEFSDLMYARWDGKEWVARLWMGLVIFLPFPQITEIVHIRMNLVSSTPLPLIRKAIPISVIMKVIL